jgi:polyisoprenoid-binding protein YceI
VAAVTYGNNPGSARLRVFPGSWRVDAARSYASFSARVAGGPVRGRLGLTGRVRIAQPIEDSEARLTARAGTLSTGSALLDQLITGPGFLDADSFPEISFQAELLVCVPAGWRAVGQLRLKGAERPLACQLDVVPGVRPADGLAASGLAGMTITSRWALDSRWVTRQRIPGLGRRIVMGCSVALAPGL